MAKIISLFNHKGGVSKTTTTFHLGWKLASMGKKVLMIDADPQCNLTGLTLGVMDYDSLFGFYDSKRNNDIFNSLAPVFGMGAGGTAEIASYDSSSTKNENLFILAGHIRLSEFEMQVATALTSSTSLPILRRMIGAFYALIDKASKKIDADIVLIDMSPSISAINMSLLMSSDYFIVPTSPDFYCYQAIDSLSGVLPSWSDKMRDFKDGELMPKHNPKMLGIVSQNYRVYSSKGENSNQRSMTTSFQKWADKIKDITNKKLVTKLRQVDMVIEEEVFKNNVHYDAPYNLANIQNFNSLIAISQNLSIPVYELTQNEVGSGTIWSHLQNDKEVGAKITISEVDQVYAQMGQAIIDIIGK